MSPGETKNEEGGFLVSRGRLPRRLVSPRHLLREGGSRERSECLAKAEACRADLSRRSAPCAKAEATSEARAWRRRDQAVQVACSCRRRSRYLAKTARSLSRPRTERSVLPAKVCDSISSECRRTNNGLWRNAAGMCFTFIQRSARQRRNSMSSADT